MTQGILQSRFLETSLTHSEHENCVRNEFRLHLLRSISESNIEFLLNSPFWQRWATCCSIQVKRRDVGSHTPNFIHYVDLGLCKKPPVVVIDQDATPREVSGLQGWLHKSQSQESSQRREHSSYYILLFLQQYNISFFIIPIFIAGRGKTQTQLKFCTCTRKKQLLKCICYLSLCHATGQMYHFP